MRAEKGSIRRRSAWVVLAAGATALALVAVAVIARGRTAGIAQSRSADPVTELGGGGATPPLDALNEVWGLSEQRSFCTMCHNIGPLQGRTVEEASEPSDQT